MNYKTETMTAIKRIIKIIHEWEQGKIESSTALELLSPDIKIVISHVEKLHEKLDDLKKRKIIQ